MALLRRAGPTIGDLCERFLDHAQARVEAGDLSARMWAEYRRAAELLRGEFGPKRRLETIRPIELDQFRLHLRAVRHGDGLANAVRRVRTIFNWAHRAGLIDRPVHDAGLFRPPPPAERRRHARRRPRTFEPAEARRLLGVTPPGPMRAMMLLGFNAAFGQTDCATVTLNEVKRALRDGWLRGNRHKTDLERTAWLWPETREALAGLRARPGQQLAFVTKRGNPWVRTTVKRNGRGLEGVVVCDAISQEFGKLLDRAGLERRGFYACRRTFATVASETGDLSAVAAVMGHLPPAVGAYYIDRISDRRIEAVCRHARTILLGRRA